MRILLINVGKPTEIRIPQGLLYLASFLDSAGYEVCIHDESLSKNQEESLKKIHSYKADIIGFSPYSIPWQLKRVENLSMDLKKKNNNAKIVWGGWHATLYTKESLFNDFVDVAVKGPGEKTMQEITDAFIHNKPLDAIKGIAYKKNGQIIETEQRDYELKYLYPKLNFKLIDLDSYLKNHDRGSGILQFITTRGCNGRCKFCVMSNIFNGNLFRKPQEQITKELTYIANNYKVNSIHFSDDNTFRNDREVFEICDIMDVVSNGRTIPWRCAARINTLSNLSETAFKKLSGTGCEGFVIGLESGADRVLKLMRKDITLQQTRCCLELLNKNNIHKNLFSFLFNYPGETTEEAIATLSLAGEVRLLFPASIIMLHVYFPGASDSNFISMESHSPVILLSQIFDDYYNNNIRSYCVGGNHINVLRYYLNAAQSTDTSNGILKRMQKSIIRLRLKFGWFKFPFEYYFSSAVFKNMKRFLAARSCSENHD